MKNLVLFLCLLVASTAATAGEIDSKCPQHVLHGAPESKHTANTQQICRANWAAHYRYDIKGTEYVVEHIQADDVNGPGKRKDDFRADPVVPAQHRAELGDYATAGYDRGHLSPAAANTQSMRVMSESFYLTNMVPQVPNLNRGVWLRLELRVRDLVRLHNKELYVVTGAIYAPGYEKIGSGVAVPTHMFKVIVDAKAGKGIAFLFPNKMGNKISQADLMKYATTIREVEKASGLNFHPRLPNPDNIETKFDPAAWPGLDK
jgi:endonuclease G